MKLMSKENLISALREIAAQGWHRSTKITLDNRNDGAVGNTLESLLGINENNLPIPNANEWELKGQRAGSISLITLKHIEPSPTAARIVSSVLLPNYGWPHRLAGTRYPKGEMSFRSTTSATNYTARGFTIIVDRQQNKLRFYFDPSKAKTSDNEIRLWINSVNQRTGIGPINPEPYWGFEDLKYAIGNKIRNCFYVMAESKIEGGHEFFFYSRLFILSSFSFEKFLDCIEAGALLIDFDARTGHNHGTKFRLKQNAWSRLYNEVNQIL